MTRARTISTAAVLAALAVPAFGLAGCGGESADSSTAEATPLSPPTLPPPPSSADGWTLSGDVSEEKMADFCEVPGLTVQLVSTTEELRKLTVHGDGLPYLMWHHTFTDVYTNLETGKSATEVQSDNEKTVSVTDNGDGTLTIIQFKVYNAETWDEDGSLIGQRDGNFKVKKVVYHKGTLSNPYDDHEVHNAHLFEAVEDGEAVGSIGEGDAHGHFCTVTVEEIG